MGVASIISQVRAMLQEHNLPESPHLDSLTVRSVVKRLSLHKAVFVSELLRATKYLNVPPSHVREETSRIVIDHCVGSIRTILDSIQASSSAHVAAPLAAALSSKPAHAPQSPSGSAGRSAALLAAAAAAAAAAVVALFLLLRTRRQ